MSAIVRRIETASKFKERHPRLDKKARVKMSHSYFPFCLWDTNWWLCLLDPHLGREGIAIKIERNEKEGGELYTILFGDSDERVMGVYSGRNLEFLEE